jgi:heme-binding uptake protein ChaN (Tiki superfamily)
MNTWLAPLLFATSLLAQPPEVRLPDESTGIDGIARTLVSVFDQADIIALGETHQWRLDTDLRIAVVRHPDFARKVRSIVVEFGSTTEQPTLDRYIRGENVSRAQLEQVWKTTTQAANGIWDSPVYADFLAAVRDCNGSRSSAASFSRCFPVRSSDSCLPMSAALGEGAWGWG